MRFPGLATGFAIAGTFACASRAVPAEQALNCPSGYATTVTNESNRDYDVNYQDERGSIMLGVSTSRTTATFVHPGDGHGRVWLRARDRRGIPRVDGSSGVRMRRHCAGAA